MSSNLLINVYNIKNNEDIIEYECNDTTTIYDLKNYLCTNLNQPLKNIHILKTNNKCDYIKNSENIFSIISTTEKIYYIIIKNKCALCSSKSATIVGDCKFCNCSYCLNHRLPEDHKCINLNVCRENSYNLNKNKVLSEKCVASKV